MQLRTCCFGLVAAIAVMGAFAPRIVKWFVTNFVSTEENVDAGTFNPRTLAELQEDGLLKEQRYLVVGGTKGIGRGIAIALAGVGASVDIVGRSGGEAVVESMRMAARDAGTGDSAEFNFWRADLASLAGCTRLVDDIVKGRFAQLDALHLKQVEEATEELTIEDLVTYEQLQYNGVVFTVGVWPDAANPLSPDGFDRVVFMDIIARYAVWRGLLGSRLIQYGSKVMSVLGSAQRAPDTPQLVEVIKQKFQRYDTPEKKKKFSASLSQMAGMASVGDLMLQLISFENPDMTVIGTSPGFIKTNLIDATFGSFAANLMFYILGSLRLTLTEEECGLRHVNILANDLASLNFVDQYLINRNPPEVLANYDLQEWFRELMNPLTEDVFFDGAGAVSKAKEADEKYQQ